MPDWFFIGSKPILLIAIVAYGLIFVSILIGYKMVEGKIPWSFNFLIFILLYSIYEPFWLMKAVYNIITKNKVNWR